MVWDRLYSLSLIRLLITSLSLITLRSSNIGLGIDAVHSAKLTAPQPALLLNGSTDLRIGFRSSGCFFGTGLEFVPCLFVYEFVFVECPGVFARFSSSFVSGLSFGKSKIRFFFCMVCFSGMLLLTQVLRLC